MENTVNAVSEQNVVDSANVGGQETASSVVGNLSAEGQVTKPKQDSETNAAFAAMRREKERLEAELEGERKKASRLVESLRADGYKSSNADDLADELQAQRENITIDEIRNRRRAETDRINEAVKNDPEYKKAQSDAEKYRKLVHDQILQADLDEINKAFPDAKLKNLDDLGEDFNKLRAMGISNLVAYTAVMESKKAQAPIVPPTPGSVATTDNVGEKDYYSPEDVDKLKPSDITPKIYEKIRASMTKWHR